MEPPGDASFGVMPGMAYAISDTTGQSLLERHPPPPTAGLSLGARGFVELAGQALRSKRQGGNVVTFDAGLTYAIDLDTQLDVSVTSAPTARRPTARWPSVFGGASAEAGRHASPSPGFLRPVTKPATRPVAWKSGKRDAPAGSSKVESVSPSNW